MLAPLESALRNANELGDEKLYAALQLAEGDRQLEALLHPLPHSLRNGVDVPFDEGSHRFVMCPDLYRAVQSGSTYQVSELLGFREETTCHINKAGNDVEVRLEDPNQNWGGRVHADGLCTLQEVTAEKNTVLHIAAEQGHIKLVEQIIQRDSTLMLSENTQHETPLHLAARAGNCQIVSLMIFLAQDSGIGAYRVLTKRCINEDTVLHEAARHGHDDVAQVLMTVAPALSAEINKASMSPLYLAVVRKSVGVVKALLQYVHTSAVGPNKQNALHAAVLGSQEIVSMLLDWKADLAKDRDVSGSTPLHYAASRGDVTVVKNILDKAPLAVYIQDQEGSSPLHVAARMCNYYVLSYMIEQCPDSFELRNNQGQNFLHIAVQHGGEEININHCDLKKIISIIKLVSRSPDLKKLVNERDNEGNTPLHFASMNGFSEAILQLLKTTEADANLMNNEGKTALDHAVSLNNFFIMAGATITLSAYGALFSPQRQDKIQNSWTNKTTQWIHKISKNLIVVSVLIATIAFSAAFNVPGSYNSNGVASLRKNYQYQVFLIFDAIAMSTSMSAAVLLVVGKAVSKRGSLIGFSLSLILLWISLYTMEFAFVLAVSLSFGDGRYPITSTIHSLLINVFCMMVFSIYNIALPAKLSTIRKFLSSMKEQTPTACQIAIQFPKLTSYARRSILFIFLNLFFFITTQVILWMVPLFLYL